ncbi:Lrp/AsnC family transcriptional regulator [uncultured Sphaerochaeta sp.]|jgi:Lrp/AsnC family transcriptional regulator for asnA, asnC and gidA|uniref:Lrp/AsnC family transcriptional regulator n=2 Tax=Sphaerochaeta TaxID=399320 RepID=UPI0018E98CD1|nr:Lrp/AsnC family transcriptional regulator [uncultured Sphaerochaeta sp.]MBJ2356147.1 Lrp/AsnC family transcriptional regulator [Sphaerochaeta sp. S2]MCK9347986.1 Lrp/AsnC family transcriptional regulator [Sphaerochaeta sp.]MDC7229394.1 Lrp/AsnC family transcriptional regulator [Sphaerochaetaceae bacterium]MDD4301237.1 Lrp/AsnC family transcriptional regulator [Sphaerochaeta sp.]MDD4646713.1 Lrp/AsnC family transcriptional regulator [Sphaerochaeta sp.]
MKVKMDETNKAIIRQLRDGRKPFSAIAEELSITENTVRARVNKLIEEGVLEISGLVNPEVIPGLQVVMMGVKLKTLDLERKAKEFSSLRGIISASVVTGRYDLIVHLVLSEEEGLSLLDFFKTELDKISEISEVETFVVYQSHNLRIPYIL